MTYDILIPRRDGIHNASYQRNRLAEKSMADILVFIDDDVIYTPIQLECIRNVFSHKNIIALFTSQSHIDTFHNLASIHFNNRIRYNHSKLPEYVNMLYGTCCAILRKEFEPFDENIVGVEDVELGTRLAKKGKIYHYKGISVIHAKHISFTGLLVNDFKRTMDRVKLWRGKGKLPQSNPKTQLLSTLLWWCPLAILALNYGFLKYTTKHYNLWFAIKTFTLLIPDMFVCSVAIWWALVKGEKYV